MYVRARRGRSPWRYPSRQGLHAAREKPFTGITDSERHENMTDTTTVWFITGAARGMGVDLAKAALDAGNAVVATARDAANVTAALGEHERLLAVSLDIT